MTQHTTRQILLRLIANGDSPVVVFDIDEFRLFQNVVGASDAAEAVARLTALLEKPATRANGHVHLIEPDRFLVDLPSNTYDEAVGFAERRVDEVRALAVPFARVPGGRLSVTAAVVSVGTSADVERFDARVDDLLRDGKSIGGDAIIRAR